MNVFVTGGTGLVGSHTVAKLVASGHSVAALVRDDPGENLIRSLGASPVRGNILATKTWDAVRPDLIVHAAAVLPGRRSKSDFYSVNVEASRLAARAAQQTGARLIHISSVAVYGKKGARARGHRITESESFDYQSERDHYSRTKRAAEIAIGEVASEGGLKPVMLRPCVVYGERDRLFGPRVFRAMRFGVFPIIGHGRNKLTAVYAGSVADAILAAANRADASGAFNITDDGGVTQRDFFRALAEAYPGTVRLITVPRPIALGAGYMAVGAKLVTSLGKRRGYGTAAVRFMSSDNPYSSAKARRELRWEPSLDPAAGLERTARWLAANVE